MSGAPSKCLLWFNGQKFDHCTCYGALGVNHDIPHTSLRVNGVSLGKTDHFRSCWACRSIELFLSSPLDVQQFARVFLSDALYTVGVGLLVDGC